MRCKWVRFSLVKVAALCASLLAVAVVASALVGCGTCIIHIAPPPHVVLTVDNGVVYGVSDKRFAMERSPAR